jgi:hypothetical protein
MSLRNYILGKSIYEGNTIDNIFYWGEVVSVTDPYDANRIKARIKGIDDKKSDEELPFAFPMMQRFLHIVPKVGETVIIFVPNKNNIEVDRMYIGPIISQPQFLEKDKHLFTSKSLLDSGYKNPIQSHKKNPKTAGVFPEKEHIALQGRLNTDILFKENEICIRVGKYIENSNKQFEFNKKTQGYINIKHDYEIDENTKGSVTNIVSNKINLLTYDGHDKKELADNKEQIKKEVLDEILEKAQPLVFGYELLEYLKLMKDAFINHLHRYPGLPPEDPSGTEYIDKFVNFDLNKLISKNIRIN